MAVYTHGHHGAVLRSHRSRTAANSAGYLLDRLTAGQSLLDVGCGPGTITADLAALVAPGRVVAVDQAADVLDDARAVAAERGLTNVEFRTGDVAALDFPDGTFDVVHAHQVLQHVADPVGALREMRRVCRPGGVIAARDVDYAAMTWYPENPGLDRWLAIYRRTARHNGGEPDAGRRLLSWARAAGCTGITCTASTWCFATPDERRFWSETWAERIMAPGIGDAAVAYGYATEADRAAIAAAWRDWGANEDGWFAITHGEILSRLSGD
ncbi:MAG TPA: methyltransferase domain-containing protein [Actinophytocola sp.]|uniref:methyltransferase domain-containing protein n=1 Tax=Actinophytocola sp. TaxID=1872138 RepID=UPI002DB8EDDD|nr:methyltransferase domain-containing protein [Actinophytocola sp.]HEU5473184.1 methyltransferase domain-containing protein [Actinophytocola sp.]